ncbi:hypothetical protein PR048_014625 [Dryococelus australis]|uniref:Transmembrane protein n=1 Tax=Dryococelus australis TaxID=614101 RepID=A0ABQ9HEQ7_9NEOP|nr:hypothetical protein PR048_014625 [Dryococelus australis]
MGVDRRQRNHVVLDAVVSTSSDCAQSGLGETSKSGNEYEKKCSRRMPSSKAETLRIPISDCFFRQSLYHKLELHLKLNENGGTTEYSGKEDWSNASLVVFFVVVVLFQIWRLRLLKCDGLPSRKFTRAESLGNFASLRDRRRATRETSVGGSDQREYNLRTASLGVSGMVPHGNPASKDKKRGGDTSDTKTHALCLIAPTRKTRVAVYQSMWDKVGELPNLSKKDQRTTVQFSRTEECRSEEIRQRMVALYEGNCMSKRTAIWLFANVSDESQENTAYFARSVQARFFTARLSTFQGLIKGTLHRNRTQPKFPSGVGRGVFWVNGLLVLAVWVERRVPAEVWVSSLVRCGVAWRHLLEGNEVGHAVGPWACTLVEDPLLDVFHAMLSWRTERGTSDMVTPAIGAGPAVSWLKRAILGGKFPSAGRHVTVHELRLDRKCCLIPGAGTQPVYERMANSFHQVHVANAAAAAWVDGAGSSYQPKNSSSVCNSTLRYGQLDVGYYNSTKAVVFQRRSSLMQHVFFPVKYDSRGGSIRELVRNRRKHRYLLVSRGSGGLVARLPTFHLGEPGCISAGVAPGFSHVGIVPDDAAGRRISSGSSVSLSLSPQPLYFPTLLLTHLASPSSALKTSIIFWAFGVRVTRVKVNGQRSWVSVQRYDGNTARLARRSDEALGGVLVSPVLLTRILTLDAGFTRESVPLLTEHNIKVAPNSFASILEPLPRHPLRRQRSRRLLFPTLNSEDFSVGQDGSEVDMEKQLNARAR